MYKGYSYVSQKGIMKIEDYPYVAKDGKCKFTKKKTMFKNVGMVQEKALTNEQLKALILRQPVGVGIVTNGNFKFFKNGVMTEEYLKCSDPKTSVNHGVAVVGFGKTVVGEVANKVCSEYWIVRNTWGSNWGDQGFFKLCMDGTGKEPTPYGTCQINRFPTYPTMEKKKAPR